MNNEFIKILVEFEKYDRQNQRQSAIGRYADTLIPADNPAEIAFSNYKRQKLAAIDALDKPRRFREFLNHRRDLLDALGKSIIQGSEKEIAKEAERMISDELQKMADKTVKYYFKLT